MTSDPFSPEPMACSSVGGCSQLSVEAFSRSVAERLLLRFTDTQWSGTCVIYKINSWREIHGVVCVCEGLIAYLNINECSSCAHAVCSSHALDIQYNRKWEPHRECEINLYTLTLCMTENSQLYGNITLTSWTKKFIISILCYTHCDGTWLQHAYTGLTTSPNIVWPSNKTLFNLQYYVCTLVQIYSLFIFHSFANLCFYFHFIACFHFLF